jgi:hypothetical protein
MKAVSFVPSMNKGVDSCVYSQHVSAVVSFVSRLSGAGH